MAANSSSQTDGQDLKRSVEDPCVRVVKRVRRYQCIGEPNPDAVKFLDDSGVKIVEKFKHLLCNPDVKLGVEKYMATLNKPKVFKLCDVDLDAPLIFKKDQVEVADVEGDGNCLFYALGFKDAMKWRKKVSSWLKRHKTDDVIVNGIATGSVEDAANECNLKKHRKHLKHSTSKPWPGELEIFALAQMQMWNIIVCQKKRDGNFYKLAEYGSNDKKAKHLQWIGNHYLRITVKK